VGLRRGSRAGRSAVAENRVQSIADDLDQRAFAAAAVEFAVKDLLPGTEIEAALGDGDDDFPPHDLAFQVGVGVILSGAIMVVLGSWGMRGEVLEPRFVILVQPGFIVVDEDRRGDVHGVDEAQPFLHAAFADEFFDGGGDVHETPAAGNFEPEMFGEGFHGD